MTSNFEKMEARKKANYAEMRRRQASDELWRQTQAAQFKAQQDAMTRQQQVAKEHQETSLRRMQEFTDRCVANDRNKNGSDRGYVYGGRKQDHSEIPKAVFLATTGLAAAKMAGANLTWKQVFAPVIIWLAFIFGTIFLLGVLFAFAMLARP